MSSEYKTPSLKKDIEEDIKGLDMNVGDKREKTTDEKLKEDTALPNIWTFDARNRKGEIN